MQNNNENLIKILILGDIVTNDTKIILSYFIDSIKSNFDLIIANCENVSKKGINFKSAKFLIKTGIDILTSGNHIWATASVLAANNIPLLRPANVISCINKTPPGKGYIIKTIKNKKICVLNLQGKIFINDYFVISPFYYFENFIKTNIRKFDILIIDFHGEATAEKQAFLHTFSKYITILYGTHTHIQTNDLQLFNNKTVYITDIGCCGLYESILGFNPNKAKLRYLFPDLQLISHSNNIKQKLFKLEGIQVYIDSINLQPVYLKEVQFICKLP